MHCGRRDSRSRIGNRSRVLSLGEFLQIQQQLARHQHSHSLLGRKPWPTPHLWSKLTHRIDEDLELGLPEEVRGQLTSQIYSANGESAEMNQLMDRLFDMESESAETVIPEILL